MRYLLSMLVLCVSLTGCAMTDAVEDLTATQSAIATMAIKAGVADLITKDEDTQAATATKIVEIATDALEFIDSGEVTLLDTLDEKIREKVDALELSPTKALLADTLLTMINAQIEDKIDGNILDAETVVTVGKALAIIISSAEPYE